MARSQTDKNILSRIKGIVEKGLGTSLLPQVVLISSIKPISSSISLMYVLDSKLTKLQ